MQKLIACFAILFSFVFSQNVFSENAQVMYGLNDVGPYSSSWDNVIVGLYGNVIQMKSTNAGTMMDDSDFNWGESDKIVYVGSHSYMYGQAKSMLYKIGENEFLLRNISRDDKVYTNEIFTTSSVCHFYANEVELMKLINGWTSKDMMRIKFIID